MTKIKTAIDTSTETIEAPERIVPSCVEELENYQQADMDGIMVLVSRQAIHETIDAYWARVETCVELEAENKRLEGEIESMRAERLERDRTTLAELTGESHD